MAKTEDRQETRESKKSSPGSVSVCVHHLPRPTIIRASLVIEKTFLNTDETLTFRQTSDGCLNDHETRPYTFQCCNEQFKHGSKRKNVFCVHWRGTKVYKEI